MHGPSTRQDLAAATGLTGATISRIVDESMRYGLVDVIEARQESQEPRMGRPTTLIDLVPDRVYVGSIYIAGEKAHLGVHDARGRLVAQHRVAVSEPDQAERTLVALAAELRQLAERSGVAERMIRVGASVLGGVDEAGYVVVAHPTWHDVPASDILHRELGVPIAIDRMQHGLVTAEAWLGAGVGVRSVATIDVSDGIGAAISIDGRVITGFDHREGQLGHFVVPGIERECRLCGREGCLQAQIRDSAFAVDARAVLGDGAHPDDLTTIDRLYQAARQGDADAVALVEARSRHIGYALALVTAVVDPELIVVSGPSLIAGWDLIEPVVSQERHQRSPLPHEKRRSRIVPSSFGTDAVLVGTASLALQHFYTEPDTSLVGLPSARAPIYAGARTEQRSL
ncbi:ROK family protein [Ruania alba]|uniref:Sugar kinase of the NBD/HSP70 family, may contain an N-terminal HTH domain n=1 Tax=Ruania alba TaxID=648782 RepID=A0A1H5FZL5_9MICO|nr:ROK family protein [Ruania alba]SEE08604.1 Sugar kinase of the NBD/HSP70 family, may contain an N-terminal HTH domain [Ruania alba]